MVLLFCDFNFLRQVFLLLYNLDEIFRNYKKPSHNSSDIEFHQRKEKITPKRKEVVISAILFTQPHKRVLNSSANFSFSYFPHLL